MDANGTPAENVAESRLIRWKRERKEPYRFGEEVRVAAQEAERFAVAGDAELLFESTLPSTHGVDSQFLSGQCDELRDAQTEFPEFRQMVEFDHEVILRGPFIREWRAKRSGDQAVIEAVGRDSVVVDDESRIERVEHDNNAFWRLRSFAELIARHLENAGVPMPNAALHGGETSEGRLLWWARAVVKGCPVSSQETNCDNAFLTIRLALRHLTDRSPSETKPEADAVNRLAEGTELETLRKLRDYAAAVLAVIDARGLEGAEHISPKSPLAHQCRHELENADHYLGHLLFDLPRVPQQSGGVPKLLDFPINSLTSEQRQTAQAGDGLLFDAHIGLFGGESWERGQYYGTTSVSPIVCRQLRVGVALLDRILPAGKPKSADIFLTSEAADDGGGDALQSARSALVRLKAKSGEKRLADLSPEERTRFDESIAAMLQHSEDERRDWLLSQNLPSDLGRALRVLLNDVDTDLDPTLVDDIPIDNAIAFIDMAMERKRLDALLSVEAAARFKSIPSPVPKQAEAAVDDDGKADSDSSAEYLIEDTDRHFEIRGFSEKMTIPKSEGIERLIAVVTSPDRRLPILYLYKIGSGRRRKSHRSSGSEELIDLNGNGISERESPVDETCDSRFDKETPDSVWERVEGLSEERDLARRTGNEDEAQRLTKVLDTIYDTQKKLVKNARDAVRNTIDAAINRIDEKRFPNLRNHFRRSVDLSDDKRDYVFAPAGLDIVWKISKS